MRKILRIFFLLLCFGIAGSCLFLAYRQWNKYDTANKKYEKIRNLYAKEKKTQKGKGKWLDIDWKKFKETDVVAWIYMDSGADYPIVQGETTTEYLHKDPYGDYSINGSIMLNSHNHKYFSDKNTVIYGHNMNNGSMFGSNKKYKEKKYAKKHRVFYIFTPKGRFTYKIFQTHVVEDATDIYRVDFQDDKDFTDWLKERKQNCLFSIDKTNPADKVCTLSTCTSNGEKRFVIQGYLNGFESYDHKTRKNREDCQEKFNNIVSQPNES